MPPPAGRSSGPPPRRGAGCSPCPRTWCRCAWAGLGRWNLNIPSISTPMTTPQYRHHAKASLGEMLLFDVASRYQPAYEGLVTMHISKRMISEERKVRDRGMKALIETARGRLEETDHGMDKWRYTKAHSLHVG